MKYQRKVLAELNSLDNDSLSEVLRVFFQTPQTSSSTDFHPYLLGIRAAHALLKIYGLNDAQTLVVDALLEELHDIKLTDGKEFSWYDMVENIILFLTDFATPEYSFKSAIDSLYDDLPSTPAPGEVFHHFLSEHLRRVEGEFDSGKHTPLELAQNIKEYLDANFDDGQSLNISRSFLSLMEIDCRNEKSGASNEIQEQCAKCLYGLVTQGGGQPEKADNVVSIGGGADLGKLVIDSLTGLNRSILEHQQSVQYAPEAAGLSPEQIADRVATLVLSEHELDSALESTFSLLKLHQVERSEFWMRQPSLVEQAYLYLLKALTCRTIDHSDIKRRFPDMKDDELQDYPDRAAFNRFYRSYYQQAGQECEGPASTSPELAEVMAHLLEKELGKQKARTFCRAVSLNLQAGHESERDDEYYKAYSFQESTLLYLANDRFGERGVVGTKRIPELGMTVTNDGEHVTVRIGDMALRAGVGEKTTLRKQHKDLEK